ncbi:MAG: c-type cytochrome, partial [Planctomycetes bacterium]|nr:c-type cytochrome [Planctomycetota bacterium]
TAAPQLLYLRDKDGDGKVDSREVLLEGFNEGNQQLRLNHLRIGLDGWVYCANGGHHPNHGLGTKVHSKRNGKTYEIGSRDFRFRPDTGEVEAESGPSQYGRNRDAWGHWFGTQNANPLWHYVLPARYMERNPHVATDTTIKHLVGPGSPPVYPASSLEKRFHSFEQSGHFTSACSGMIYGDEVLFGKGKKLHAFTCEPFHNLVQHNVLSEDGVSFRASRPIGEGKLDFFASEDRWCRPVMVRTGPDGGLWIADMVRYMIEHPEWLPAEGKSELEPHYRLGDEAGRIYRVMPASGASRPEPLDTNNGSSLLLNLQSSNDWVRTTAHAWLLWNHDTSLVPQLEELARAGATPESRYHAICILDSLESLTEALLVERLRDESTLSPRVLEGLLRIAERRQTPEVVSAAAEAADNSDSKVCLQLALSCGEWKNPLAAHALTKLAESFPQDPYFRAAIMSSALVHAQGFARGISISSPDIISAFRVPLLRQSLAINDQDTIAILVTSAIEHAKEGHGVDQLDLTLLELQRLGVDLRNLATRNPDGEIARSVAILDSWAKQLQRTAESENVDPTERIAALIPLSRMQPYRSDAVQRLSQWMDSQTSLEQKRLAMSALAQSGHDDVPEVFAKSIPTIHKELLRPMMDAWLTREAWVGDLLGRLESSEISPALLDATQQARMLDYPNPELAKRYRELPWNRQIAAREEVYQAYTASLELKGDARAGSAAYSRACASCHRRGERSEGADIGPNLASVVGHSQEKLLRNIVIPSADVQPGYYAYSCLLESGEVVSGVLVSETATSVAIKQTNGEIRGIPRSEIDVLRNTNRSLMPDGLEASIDHQQMADLIAYLQTPIPVP